MTVWDKPPTKKIVKRYGKFAMDKFLAIDWSKHRVKFARKFPFEETAAVVAYLQYTSGRYDGNKRSAKQLYGDLQREWKKYDDSGRPDRYEQVVIGKTTVVLTRPDNRGGISDDEYTMAPENSDEEEDSDDEGSDEGWQKYLEGNYDVRVMVDGKLEFRNLKEWRAEMSAKMNAKA
jgi:hypothetical protein